MAQLRDEPSSSKQSARLMETRSSFEEEAEEAKEASSERAIRPERKATGSN